ncbi:MAG: Sec-independent protein translocase subunit TatA/TatB [Solirubrobacterales bacterium]
MGPLEIIVVLIIALVVFGPKRLPELGNSLGRGIREFKETVTGEKQDDDEDDAKLLQASEVRRAKAPESTPVATAPVEKPTESEVAHDKPS